MIVQSGRQIRSDELIEIRETVKTFGNLSRRELAQTVCEHLNWHTVTGSNKIDSCIKLLERLESQGVFRLPEKRRIRQKTREKPIVTDRTKAQDLIERKLSDICPVSLRIARDKEEKSLFKEYIERYHYLGYKQPFGCYLQYFIEGIGGKILGCLLFSGASKALKSRDEWIGWNLNERLRNLGFVVNNGRFLILPWVKVPHLASHILGKAIKGLVREWEKRWGYRPVLLETFVDPQYFDGTCYRAANFKYLGMTTGMGLVRKGKSYTTSPKKIFVYPLVDNFRQVLCSNDAVGAMK